VSEKVVVCESVVPDVAVTVTVDVTGCEPPPPPPPPVEEPAPPPQLVSRPRLATLTASSRSTCKHRRFFQPKQHSATARAEPGSNGRDSRWSVAELAIVFTVSVVDVVPGGITVNGEKLHEAPEGKPEQLKETAESNPFVGVTVAEIVPL
jgi:hypothetical protein